MTYKQFLAELRQISGWCMWRNGAIRRNNHGGWRWRWECPITAVCRKVRGMKFESLWATAAADELGLAPTVASRIIGAADLVDSPKTRRDLLKTCGLKEDANG